MTRKRGLAARIKNIYFKKKGRPSGNLSKKISEYWVAVQDIDLMREILGVWNEKLAPK